MNSLEEVKEVITKIEGGDKIYDAVASIVMAERERGKKESQEANKEAQNLRTKYKKPLEELGIDLEQDIVSQLKDMKVKATKADELGKGSTKATEEILSYQKRLGEMEKTLAQITKEKEESDHKLRTKAMREALSSEFGDKIYAKDHTITALIADGRVQFDGENVIFVEGDNKLPLADGVKSLIEGGKVDVKISQKPGQGPGGQGGTSDRTESEKLAYIQRLRG
jgi:hypothetical protein